MKTKGSFRTYVAVSYMKEEDFRADRFTESLDRAFSKADDLWNRATRGDKKAVLRIGKLAKMYMHSYTMSK